MKKFELKISTFTDIVYILIVVFFLLVYATSASAHGPKGHSSTEFTALQAVKKGFVLYDRLVSSGKLSESWATDLVNIEVLQRTKKHKNEYVVKFTRSKGDPGSVYIFFTEKGNYSGSNFTGK